MLTALLLACFVSLATPEWVEISQQHYRKPVRTHAYHHVTPKDETGSTAEESTRPIHNFPKKDPVRFTSNNPKEHVRPTYIEKESVRLKPAFTERDEQKIYSNHSISEHSWNQNRYRAPGNIERFDAEGLKVKANITPEFSLEIYEPVGNLPVLPTRNRPNDQDRVPATVERVHNKGNVKRVELSNTPVKSPSLTNAVATISPIRINDIRKYGTTPVYDDYSDEFEIKSDIFKETHKKVIYMTPISDVKHIFTTTHETSIMNYDMKTSSTSTTSLPISEAQRPFQKYPQIQKAVQLHKTENNKKDFIRNNFPVEDNNHDSEENVKTKHEQRNSSKNITANEVIINKDNPKFVRNNEPGIEDIDFEEVTINSYDKNRLKQNNRPPLINTQYTKDQNKKPSKDTNNLNNKTSEEIKMNTMENVLKFMKVVADTISQNTKRGVNGKVKYLNELKVTLLGSIKDRIDATWPDDGAAPPAPARRRSRAATATARGHVEFPSSESALMTISFLTFAVFLIKLVLQVIQTYKNKAMMVAPLVVATAGRAVGKLRTVN